MKNVKIMLMLLVLFLTLPVFAEEIIITKVTQAGIELNKVNDVYQANYIEMINIEYECIGIEEGLKFYTGYGDVVNAWVTDGPSIPAGFSNGKKGNFLIGPNGKDVSIEIVLYDTTDPFNYIPLTSKTVSISFNGFDDISNSIIYILNAKQGGKEITPSVTGAYEFNNVQDVEYTIKGENLISKMHYAIYVYDDNNRTIYPYIYTGEELMNGVTFKCVTKPRFVGTDDYPTDDFYMSSYFSVGLNTLNHDDPIELFKTHDMTYSNLEIYIPIKPYLYKNEEEIDFMVNLNDDVNVSDHNLIVKPFYKNYETLSIILESYGNLYDMGEQYYRISNKYHNQSNPLSINLTGEDYEDKDYTVEINIDRNGDNVYTKSLIINGLLLNSGYNTELVGWTSQLNKVFGFRKSLYNIEVTIDNITSTAKYDYSFSEKEITIIPEIFYEDGKKSMSTSNGSGNYYYDSPLYYMHKDTFENYDKLYYRFIAKGLEENETYTYKFIYGNATNLDAFGNLNTGITFNMISETKTAMIKGTDFMKNGVLLEATNPDNASNPIYRLEIYHNDEMLYYDEPFFKPVDRPVFTSTSIKSNNKNRYLKVGDYEYLVTKNSKIEITFSGIGWDDDTEYTIPYTVYYYHNANSTPVEDVGNIFVTGKKINEGKASLVLNKDFSSYESAYFYMNASDIIYTEDYYNNGGDWLGEIDGRIDIKFINNKDYFPEDVPYLFDDGAEIIKSIKKNTSVEDFVTNLNVKDNGKIKIIKKDGSEEKGNVGTGMTAQVCDEYGNSLSDLDVVVKGDVSGDGDISILDLVKIAQEADGKNVLEGVYEIAADLSGTGVISNDEVQKIAKDIVGLGDVE